MKTTQKNGKMQKRFLIRLFALFSVLWLSFGISVPMLYRQNMEAKYSLLAYSFAHVAAEVVPGDKIAGYARNRSKDAEYGQVLEKLKYIRDVSHLKYLYIVIPMEKEYFYIWDAGDPASEGGVCDLGDADEYYQGGDVDMKQAFSGNLKEDKLLVTDSEEYGYVASAFVPINDSTGKPVALACVDISMEEVNGDIRNFLLIFGVFMVAIMLVAGIMFYAEIARLVIKPIQMLDSSVDRFTKEQMHSGGILQVDIHTNDEIENLAESFVGMSRELRNYMTEFEKATKEKERNRTELAVATNIQYSLLPSVFPAFPERKDFDLYATMDTAKEVGGDFYDFFMAGENHLALVIADVSGKGVPAALFMMRAKTLIKNGALVSGSLSPAEILMHANDELCEGNEAGMFVTVWLGILDLTTGKGLACNAGHGSPAMRKAGGSFELTLNKVGSPAVAVMEGVRFKEHEFEMRPGDGLYLCTDGVTEAIDKEEVFFGTDRLLEALNENPDAKPEEMLANVKKHMDAFIGEADQFDDITMLGFVYYGSAENKGGILSN